MNRYDVLGLKADATQDEVKKAYRKLAAKTHPDVAGAVMAPLFMSVQDAYETLSNPAKRAAYDRELGCPHRETAPSEPAAPEPPRQPRHEAPTFRQPVYEEETYQEPAATPPGSLKLRRLKLGLLITFFAGLGGYWIFQEIQLLQIVQPKGGIRLLTAPGLPAIIYAVLWAVGTLIATFADEIRTAWKAPVFLAGLSAGFAFITATWSTGLWLPTLITGAVLTYSIAAAVRFRNDRVRQLR
ncbi:J domain-containing protein [Arthrobacter sp. UYCo732]|uniref:J domain-containing protein n=1 Tax=Arthrobacter sp. UYCo732 TaxID=3156336 RepID=UPI00339466B8